MSEGNSLIERYLKAKWSLPGWAQQAIIDSYMAIFHTWDRLSKKGRRFVTPHGGVIAEDSQRLMDVHYNMPLGLFANFLGPRMKYSMAIWERGGQNLEEAQDQMLADVCEKAKLAEAKTVFDLGCGFGSFCRFALENYPELHVTGLNISQTQLGFIREKQREPSHPFSSGRFTILEENFNTYRSEQPFDRLVSLGVLEHFADLPAALARMHEIIAPGGYAFHHYIAYHPFDEQHRGPIQDPFCNKHIFPGGRIHAYDQMTHHPEPFTLAGEWFFNGRNYQRTLEAWLKNFLQNREMIRREAELDTFTMKLWEVYLRACIGMFKREGGRFYGNGQYLLQRY